jgi:hypothetical protein
MVREATRNGSSVDSAKPSTHHISPSSSVIGQTLATFIGLNPRKRFGARFRPAREGHAKRHLILNELPERA